jgi:hypothetical protein
MISEELAKLKIERAIALGSNYDSLNEESFKQMLLCLNNALQVIPRNSNEKEQLQGLVGSLMDMDIKKFGYVFKASSWKNSILINKNDIIELIWRTHSLLY